MLHCHPNDPHLEGKFRTEKESLVGSSSFISANPPLVFQFYNIEVSFGLLLSPQTPAKKFFFREFWNLNIRISTCLQVKKSTDCLRCRLDSMKSIAISNRPSPEYLAYINSLSANQFDQVTAILLVICYYHMVYKLTVCNTVALPS